VSLYVRLSERLPTQQTTCGRLTVESGLVCLGVVVVGFCADVVVRLLHADRQDLHVVLALLAAAVGTAAAGLGHTAGRVAGNRRAMWLIPALALYSVDVVPDTIFPLTGAEEPGAQSVGLVVDCATVAVLLVVAVRPPGRAGPGLPWAIACVGGLVGLVLEHHGGPQPETGLEVSPPTAVNLAVLLGWCAVSSAVVVAGYRAASPPLWRVGLGFGVVASAHVYRTAADPFTGPSVLFGALRLFGVFVVMLGMAQLLRRALNKVLTEQCVQQEELRVASIRARQVVRLSVEREHELRNGLAGLAGIARLLVGDDDRTRHARSAAVTELSRLTALLDRRHAPAPVGLYCASEIVDELVALWRMEGMDLEASVPAALMAVGRSSTLGQVMTNLLVNCARHAPGAPVRIVACERAGRVVIEVRNDHSGDAPTSDGRATTAGDGMGLEISRRLLGDEGGELRVQPIDPRWPGWTVSISLVAAPEPRPPALVPASGPATEGDVGR